MFIPPPHVIFTITAYLDDTRYQHRTTFLDTVLKQLLQFKKKPDNVIMVMEDDFKRLLELASKNL